MSFDLAPSCLNGSPTPIKVLKGWQVGKSFDSQACPIFDLPHFRILQVVEILLSLTSILHRGRDGCSARTAAANWMGKSRLAALRQGLIDEHTNSQASGIIWPHVAT